MNKKDGLVAVTKISTRGISIRMTLPREVSDFLDMQGSEHIGFHKVDGNIVIKKIE